MMKKILASVFLNMIFTYGAIAASPVKISDLPDGGYYNPATDIVPIVRNSGGLVTKKAILGGEPIDPRAYGATCDGATYSLSRPVQVGSHDDTTAFVAAAIIAQQTGRALLVPHGCWITGLTLPSGVSMVGEAHAVNYGYDYVSGEYPSKPELFIIGHPSIGIDLSGVRDVALVGFQVNAQSDSAAFASTSCVGTTSAAGGTGGKIFLENFSMKGCKYGLRPTVGLLFLVSHNTDWGANDVGLSGTFSDILIDGDTFVSGTTGIEFVSGAGGYARIANSRFEYLNNAVLGSDATLQIDMVGNQFDHMAACAIQLNNVWNDVHITGGNFRGNGLKGSLTVTGAANNGSGLIRLTVNGYYSGASGGGVLKFVSTSDKITVDGVGGTTEANGTWTVTRVDDTHLDLQGSTFTHSYTSGGYAGVWDKAANICTNGTSNAKGLHLSNVGFYSSAALGQAAAPAFLIDAHVGSAYDHISLAGGGAYKIGTSGIASNYTSFTTSAFNWQSGAPSNLVVNVEGIDPINTANSIFSINGSGNVGIGTSSATANVSLDIGSRTDSFLPPKGSTAQAPGSCTEGAIRYDTTLSKLTVCSSSTWISMLTGQAVHANTFQIVGTQTVSNDKTNWVIMPATGTISKAWAVAKTGPTGQALIFDIKKSTNNGSTFTSIWNSTPANRVQIAAGQVAGSQTSFDTTSFNAGDILRIDVVQIGSGVAGADATVSLVTLY